MNAAQASRSAVETLRRALIPLSWVPVAALTIFFAAGFELPEYAIYAPFAISVVFLGLPHGAVDHLAPGRIPPGEVTVRSMAVVGLLYLVLASLYLVFWFAAPVPAFALFICLTWFHWGQGDLWTLLALYRAHHLPGIVHRALTIFVRGGLPMLVPLLAFPETYREVARSMAGLFGSGVTGGAWAFEPGFRFASGVVFAALMLAALFGGLRRSGLRDAAWRADAAETLLLAAYFAFVPPVLAVGLYFCLWHATRHIARLMLIEKHSAGALEYGRLWRAAVNFTRDAAPLTVAALVLLAVLYFALPERGGPFTSLGPYLVLISILTLPHVVIVSFMDLRQGVWR